MTFASVLLALACGAMMVACMFMMRRSHREPAAGGTDAGELARLREENARLRDEHDHPPSGRS